MRPGRLVALLLVALAWLTLAPTAVGGSTTYLVTNGISMKPRMSTGDLVLVRSRPEYRVGDVIAYNSAQIGSVVLHRIVRAEDGRFVTQGDNNSWLDPDRPAGDEVIGAEWVHLRGAGTVLRAVGQPWILGLVGFGLVAAGGTAAHQRKRKRRGPVTSGKPPIAPRRTQPSESLPPPLQTAAGVLAAVGVAGAALGGMSWTRPHETLASTPSASATERMTFSYSATVPRSAAYDDTTVTAPEPVFRRLADAVEVTFRYTGSGGGSRTVSVAAELSAANGWRATVPLTRPVEVAGTEHEGRVVLDLSALDDRVAAAAEATGMPLDDVALAVVPTVSTASGEAFAPRLELELTPLQLRLAADDDETALAVEDALTLPGGMRREPATIALLGQELRVRTARIASVLLLLVGVVGGLEVRERARRAAARPEAERIRDRYGALLVDVSPVAPPPGRPVVDVPDFAALVRIAERYGLLVLHWTRSSTDTYVVQDEETVYRYRAAGAVTVEPADEAPDEPAVELAVEQHEGSGSSPRPAAQDPGADVDPEPPAPANRTILPGH